MIKIRKPTIGDTDELENLFLSTRLKTFSSKSATSSQIGDYIKSVA